MFTVQVPPLKASNSCVCSEKKIDSIVRDLADIKRVLQSPNDSPNLTLTSSINHGNQLLRQNRPHPLNLPKSPHILSDSFKPDTTTYIINFIECVAEFPDTSCLDADFQALVSSLRRTANVLKSPELMDVKVGPIHVKPNGKVGMSIPPQEAAVSVLRWARGKSYETYNLSAASDITCILRKPRASSDFLAFRHPSTPVVLRYLPESLLCT